MNYDKEIIAVLMEAGPAGLKVQKIARHVFNSCNSLFNRVSYADVHAYVSQYLIKNSRNPDSIISRTEVRGVYRLNLCNQENQQLMLRFRDTPQKSEEKPVDNSLSLFGDDDL